MSENERSDSAHEGDALQSTGLTLTGSAERIVMFTVPKMGLLGDYALFTGSGRSRISRIASISFGETYFPVSALFM